MATIGIDGKTRKWELQVHLQRTPAASDAEIRAYLHPLLKAGKPPTYKTMRAILGGGFSRLARIKKQIEHELAGGDVAEKPAGDPVGAAELVVHPGGALRPAVEGTRGVGTPIARAARGRVATERSACSS